MKYLNTVTGSVIDVPCAVVGGDWVEVQSPSDDAREEEKPVSKKRSNKNDSVRTDK